MFEIKKMIKLFGRFVLFVIFVSLFSITVRAEDLVIVIDPGHGGENLGAQWNGYLEKDMNLIVARAMKNELLKYEGVTVYLTHEQDGDMSLQERADFANEVNADFLFCLHFNMHEPNIVYGCEAWIPSKGSNYVKGYQFASIVLSELEERGIYNRGIKTRLNEKGQEYYGIIRHSEEYGIPSVIIEHCHLDHERDVEFYDSLSDLEELGKLDALAVAKYFGLKSADTLTSYEGYELADVEAPSISIKQDLSPADYVELKVVEVLDYPASVTCVVESEDYDSYVLYYSVSYDGGQTFSELYPFNRQDSVSFTVSVPYHKNLDLMVRTYNMYDQVAESGIVSVEAIEDPFEKKEDTGSMLTDMEVSRKETEVMIALEENETEYQTEDSKAVSANSNSIKEQNKGKSIVLIAVILFLIAVFIVMISAIISVRLTKK